MSDATLADLAAALAADTLDAWLTRVPDPALRERLRGALAADRRLRAQYPDSLASCLLARTLDDPACAELHASWTRELEQSSAPWIRPMRAIPTPTGLLAELYPGDHGVTFTGLPRPRFTADDEVILIAGPPRRDTPGPPRRERVRWSWTRGEAVTEPVDEPAPGPAFPRIETDGWGPAYLVRAADTPRITLPCPAEASAHAHFSADGTRLIVYGSLDEYAGGFVWVVDPTTLEVEVELDTSSPVSDVDDWGPHRMLVATYRSGRIAVIDHRSFTLPELGGALCLSPDGKHLASLGDGLRIWTITELQRRGGAPPEPGFYACFDPDGERLLSGRELLDARTGQPIARLAPDLGPYLEGGPAQPSLHLGAHHLICTHGGLQVWDTRTGQPRRVKKQPRLAHWYTLAYDRAGDHLAAVRQGESTVVVHGLPDGRARHEVRFELAAELIAMSPDARLIAVQHGAAVEVRDLSGALVRRFGGAPPTETLRRKQRRDLRLCFANDGHRVARFITGEGWCIASLADDTQQQIPDDDTPATFDALARLPDFATPRPADWSVEVSNLSVFTHHPSGTKIALPVVGRWEWNPADPHIAACNEMHLELRGR